MFSHYRQHLMTAKLPGGDGLTASVLTPPVPCSAALCRGQARGCRALFLLPLLLALPALPVEAVLPAFTAHGSSWEAQASACIFVPSHSKSCFSPSKTTVLRIMAIPKSVETLDIRAGVGKVGNFAGDTKGLYNGEVFCAPCHFLPMKFSLS